MDGKILYEEKQYFRKSFKYFLFLGIAILSLVGLVVGMFETNEPQDLAIVFVFTLFSFSIVAWLMYHAILIIKFDQRNVYYSFFPFVRTEKCLTKEDISKIALIKYNALLDHKGHGYKPRLFSKKLALTISGNTGLEIALNNGKILVLGTQKHQELQRAVEQLKNNWHYKDNHG